MRVAEEDASCAGKQEAGWPHACQRRSEQRPEFITSIFLCRLIPLLFPFYCPCRFLFLFFWVGVALRSDPSNSP